MDKAKIFKRLLIVALLGCSLLVLPAARFGLLLRRARPLFGLAVTGFAGATAGACFERKRRSIASPIIETEPQKRMSKLCNKKAWDVREQFDSFGESNLMPSYFLPENKVALPKPKQTGFLNSWFGWLGYIPGKKEISEITNPLFGWAEEAALDVRDLYRSVKTVFKLSKETRR